MSNNSGYTGNTNPETTNWEEHGAAGDVSTGRRLKYVQDVPLALKIDEASATITYLGQAKPGTASSSPLWRVKKIDTSSGVAITFADANDLFDNVWDNHASLTYS